jgi:cobalt transporter subunit CbtB
MAWMKTATQSAVAPVRTAHVVQAGAAALLGIGLFVAVAFAHPAVIHNAAHDSRHGIAVPCH